MIVKSGTPQALGAFEAALEQVPSPCALVETFDSAMQVDRKGVDLNVKHMHKQA